MIGKLMVLMITQLYWLSLPLIGYALLLFAKYSLPKHSRIKLFAEYILQLPLLVRWLLFFTFAVSTISLIVVPLYLLNAPALLFTITYIVLLISSIGYLTFLFISNKIYNKSVTIVLSLKKPKSEIIFWTLAIIVFCVLIFDYIVSLCFGGTIYLQNDVFVHLARISVIIENGFSFQDGFFKGLVESRYHANIVYALYVPPSQITSLIGALPADVWRWSLAFFRLLQWLAVSSFAYFVFKYWLKSREAVSWSLLSILCVVAFYSGEKFVANYPNEIVSLWIIAYIIGLIIYNRFRSNATIIIIIASVLLALTHPTYCVIMSLFVVFYFILRLLFMYKDSKKLKTLGLLTGSVGLMMLSPVFTKLFPNHISTFAVAVDKGIRYQAYLPVSPVSSLKLPILIFSLLSALGLIVYTYKNKPQLTVVLALILFIPIVIFNPPFLWLIGHFFTRNMLSLFNKLGVIYLIVIPLTLFFIFKIISWLSVRAKLNKKTVNTIYTLTTISCIVLCLFVAAASYKSFRQLSLFGGAPEYERIDRVNKDLSGVIDNKATVIANLDYSYMLPAALSVDVLAIAPSHATPTASIVNRVECQESILTNFYSSDLMAVNADFILLSPNDSPKEVVELISNLGYLNLVRETQDFRVYKFIKPSDSNSLSKTSQACVDFKRIESAS